MKTYLSEIDKLTQRAKMKDPKPDGLNLGEKFYVVLLNFYIKQYRRNELTDEDLKAKKALLERDLINYLDSKKMFSKACEIRNKQSPVLTEAEKNGCPICRKIVRLFDGRDN